jgi:nucleotidyltransferase/DNA polymerase involved in DNA repair
VRTILHVDLDAFYAAVTNDGDTDRACLTVTPEK